MFRAITGETLFGFIHRLRIEKAAGALLNHPDQSVLEIALDHGFASASTFARAFKTRFGMSATEWRGGGAERWRTRHRPERNVMDLPGGPCAVATFTGTADEITDAWDHVFTAWLPGSAWQSDDRPCVEVYRGRAMVDVKAGIFRCELCLPVRPL